MRNCAPTCLPNYAACERDQGDFTYARLITTCRHVRELACLDFLSRRPRNRTSLYPAIDGDTEPLGLPCGGKQTIDRRLNVPRGAGLGRDKEQQVKDQRQSVVVDKQTTRQAGSSLEARGPARGTGSVFYCPARQGAGSYGHTASQERRTYGSTARLACNTEATMTKGSVGSRHSGRLRE